MEIVGMYKFALEELYTPGIQLPNNVVLCNVTLFWLVISPSELWVSVI